MVYDMDEEGSPGWKSVIKTEQEIEHTNSMTRPEHGADPLEAVTGDVAKKMRRRFLNIFARRLGGTSSLVALPCVGAASSGNGPRVHMGDGGGGEAKRKAAAARAASARRRRALKCSSGGGGAFHCPECGMAFQQKQYMKLHERACKAMVYTGKTERTTCDCPECPAVLKDKAALAEHLLLHTDDLFRCDVCGKGFEKLSKLTNHKVHHDRRLLRFQCTDCGRAFPLLSSLRRHQRRHPRLLALCPHCPKKFRFDCMLRRHLQTHARPSHVPAAGGDCRLCGASVASLKLHLRTHAWRSPHRCGPCGVFFVDETALRAHEDGGRCDAVGGGGGERSQDSSSRRFSERLRRKETE